MFDASPSDWFPSSPVRTSHRKRPKPVIRGAVNEASVAVEKRAVSDTHEPLLLSPWTARNSLVGLIVVVTPPVDLSPIEPLKVRMAFG